MESENGYNDRLLIQGVLKEIAHSRPLDMGEKSRKFRGTVNLVVVINEADLLSLEAQAALRRTMEKYMVTCRLILCCQSYTRVISAVRSRCLCLRIGAPPIPGIVQLLLDVSEKEKLDLSRRLVFPLIISDQRLLRLQKNQRETSGELY